MADDSHGEILTKLEGFVNRKGLYKKRFNFSRKLDKIKPIGVHRTEGPFSFLNIGVPWSKVQGIFNAR